jgi:pyruvate carboxylase
MGGWPKQVQAVVLGKRKPIEGRPGESMPPLNFTKARADLAAKLKRDITEDDLFSFLMYPEVFADFAKFDREYSDVSVLPTAAYFYGLKPGEEISVDIEEGKTLFIKLINVGSPDKDGSRVLLFELNGMPRETTVFDRSVKAEFKSRPKADPDNPLQVGAPIPGLITSLHVSAGAKVAKGDKLATLEAMKMQTTIYAPTDGPISAVHVAVGDTVAARDLLVTMGIEK